jgi:hypothetical protein
LIWYSPFSVRGTSKYAISVGSSLWKGAPPKLISTCAGRSAFIASSAGQRSSSLVWNASGVTPALASGYANFASHAARKGLVSPVA